MRQLPANSDKRQAPLVLFLFLGLTAVWGAGAESGISADTSLFQRLATEYNRVPQMTVDFRHIVISDFFGTADTVAGSISFASDGRYVTRLGVDEYLFDGKCLWEYSQMYAQASRNCLKPGQRLDDSFLFLRHFNDYYRVRALRPDSVYRLTIEKEFQGKAPDSLMVTLNPAQKRIVFMEYYDINEELNRILLGEETRADTIDSALFVPSFPDSTEIIEIPG